MLAQCLKVVHEKGEYFYGQGLKKGTKAGYKKGYYCSPNGFGGGHYYKSSTLILYAVINSRVYNIRIDRFFRDYIGKLTEKRVNKIIAEMPAQVSIEEYNTQGGEKYYQVTELDLEEWLERTGIK